MSFRASWIGRLAPCLLAMMASTAVLARADETKQKGRDRSPPAAKTSVLPKALREALDGELLPAVESQNPTAILQAAAPFVRKLDAARVADVDAYLVDKGKPHLAEIIANARLQLVEQGLAVGLEPPRGKELLATLEGFKKLIDEMLAERATHHALQVPAPGEPDSLAAYERTIWDLHVLDNRVAATQRLAQYAQGLGEFRRTVRPDGLSPDQLSILNFDFSQLVRAVQDMRNQVAAQNIVLRVRRIAFADRKLTEAESLKDSWESAFVLDWDGELVMATLQRGAPKNAANDDANPVGPNDSPLDLAKITAADLTHLQLAEQLKVTIAHGREKAGPDMLKKSRMLFTGLHWWFRGRYGVGPEARGLMKTAQALKSPDIMFALYMPRTPPQPTAPGQPGLATPLVDRRHYYLWQYGNSDIVTSDDSRSSKSSQLTVFPGGDLIRTSHFY